MLREGYLARVTRLAEEMARRAKKTRGQQQSLPPGLIDLVDLLRTATIDTVEAISLWRISQVIRVFCACAGVTSYCYRGRPHVGYESIQHLTVAAPLTSLLKCTTTVHVSSLILLDSNVLLYFIH